jgi:HTH-type transcriptional regulator / antitoxin HigA
MADTKPARGFEPDWATHPGEHLEEYLEINGWSQAEFARRSSLTPKLVSEIVNQKNPVTAETALVLERVLGLKAEIWLSYQARWDLLKARASLSAKANAALNPSRARTRAAAGPKSGKIAKTG